MEPVLDSLPHEVHIHTQGEDPQVRLSLYVQNTLHTLLRPKDEVLSKALARISSTLRKKGKKKGSSNDHSDLCYVLHHQLRVDANVFTHYDWETDMVLMVGRHHFNVVVDPPVVISLATYPRKYLVVGCPIVPLVATEFTDAYNIFWYRDKRSLIEEYEYVTTSSTYIPRDEDQGRRFKIFAIPYRKVNSTTIQGRSVVFYLNGPVRYPRTCSLMKEIREEFCSLRQSRVDHELRVVTYNILSEAYTSTDYAKRHMYGFIHHPDYLESEFRSARILDELIAYKADIICLQECDRRVFECYFQPYLQQMEYSCHFGSKIGEVPEGCAMFIHLTTLAPLAVHHIPLRELILGDPLLRPIFDSREDIRDIMGTYVNSIVEVAICRYTNHSDQFILVANTHLFYHPAAAYVRLLHAYAILHLLEKIKQAILEGRSVDFRPIYDMGCDSSDPLLFTSDNPQVAIIFAGDLNSTPETAVIELIQR